MFADKLLEKIGKKAPVGTMTRVLLEHVFELDFLQKIFSDHKIKQRSRNILFSVLVDLMLLVACKIRPTINSTYKKSDKSLPFSLAALYEKLSGVELPVSEALVRETAKKIQGILQEAIPKTVPRPPSSVPSDAPPLRRRIV
ncbi:MAG: hypothetical protein ACRC2T_09600, partial [Thermoguttaceae bacterium]